jgi:hypothetical protein
VVRAPRGGASENQSRAADQLATRWQTTRGHLANQRSYGRGVPYLKLGSRVMYRLSDVLAYEAECVVRPLDVERAA